MELKVQQVQTRLPPPKIYKLVGEFGSIFINPFGELVSNSTVTCLPGDVVLSGGYNITSSFGGSFDPVRIVTEPTSSLDGWTAEIWLERGNQAHVKAIAECFDNP